MGAHEKSYNEMGLDYTTKTILSLVFELVSHQIL